MSKRPTGTMYGVILIGVGLLLVALSFKEQSDRINLGPNRFYSEADRDEFQSLHEQVFNLKKGIGGGQGSDSEDNPPSGELALSEVDDHVQSGSNGSGDPLATAQANLAALKLKQDNAFRNQDFLSMALKLSGIAFLAIGAVLLLRVSRATRMANTFDSLAPLESSGQ